MEIPPIESYPDWYARLSARKGLCPMRTRGIEPGTFLACDLRYGHEGMHHDQSGADWGTTEPVHDWLAETRVTNPKTGGEKGSKPAQLGAVDPASLLELASVAGMGSDKYARYNFARGVDWSLFFDAMMRHSLAFWGGEDMDPESGLPHMAHAAWHACALLTMMRRHRDLDDRFPS